jgi:hypothetical protein
MKSNSSCQLKIFACFVISAFSFISPAQAVTFQEQAHGDFVSNGILTIVSLDVGTNTVSGNFGYLTGSGDLDSFAFLIGAGTVLESVSVQLTPSAGNTHNPNHANWSFRSGSNTAFGGTAISNLTWNAPDLVWYGPIGPSTINGIFGQGTYNLTNNELSYSGPYVAIAKADYTFTFTVTALPVPEPESYAMLLAGFGLMGFVACRRQA